jgi:hypothetical protein
MRLHPSTWAASLVLLASAPQALQAAEHTFVLQDLATFTTFQNDDTSLTFTGTGFVGMIDDRWGAQQPVFAHVFGLETDSMSRTLLQLDLADLAGQRIVSAHLSFSILGGEAGTNSVLVRGFDSGGTLGVTWEAPKSSHSSAVGFATAFTTSTIDITEVVDTAVGDGDRWLGMHLQAVGTKYLWTMTHDYPDTLTPDLAQVRIHVVTAPVPEPGAWALLLAGGAGIAGFVRRRQGDRA